MELVDTSGCAGDPKECRRDTIVEKWYVAVGTTDLTGTLAREAVNAINACGPILARKGPTFIGFGLAQQT